ncbi:MAG: hypothetical protein LBP92_15155 [Deltaproteobacteria bacterium]|jgi:hypothetical protein|nr:hypothetical protein [Deltaproteobacteria bacterium]
MLDNVDCSQYSCPNNNCESFGIKNQGNIAIRCCYGKGNNHILLYCKLCGKKFSSTSGTILSSAHIPIEKIHQIIHYAAEGVGVRATARLLNMHKDTVNNIIFKVGEYCANFLSHMLKGLSLTEVQLDELWSFIKKKKVMTLLDQNQTQKRKRIQKTKMNTEEDGSG